MFDPQAAGRRVHLAVKDRRGPAENPAMWTHGPNPEPELGHDEHLSAEIEDVDPWSTGYIVFSLGPNFDEARFDAT
jgi:hypothetical protein